MALDPSNSSSLEQLALKGLKRKETFQQVLVGLHGHLSVLVAGRDAYVPGATVDAKTAETSAAGPGLHCTRDSAGDVQDSNSGLRRVLAGTSGLQRLQLRPVVGAGQL